MPERVRRVLLWILPVAVFVPIFVGSRFALHRVPPLFDWFVLIFCAALVVFNPGLKQIERGAGTRLLLLIASFALVMGLLLTLAFALMAVVFQDAL
jgi:hypothetical protein